MAKKNKKPNGAGEVRQRPDGKWEGRYSVGYDENGKRIRRSVYGASFKECNEKLNIVLTSIADNSYTDPKKIPLVEWLQNWLEIYARQGIKPATYTNYETYINRHIAPFFGNIALQNLTPDELQKFINYKTTGGRLDKKPGGISPKTIINMKNMIHAALKQAEINGIINRNVALLIKPPKNHKVEMRVLTDDEFYKLIETASVERSGAPILLAMYTGMRVGEVMALKFSDIDLDDDNPILHVRCSMKRDFLNSSHNKNDEVFAFAEDSKTALIRSSPKTQTSKRDIPLIPEAVDVIKKQLALIKSEKQTAGTSYLPHTFLFCNPIGFPYDQRTYQDHFNNIIKKAGIEKKIEIGTNDMSVGFHTLRHTFATRAIMAGMDILVLSKILGHAQPSTTMNQYGHVLPNHKKTSMEKFRIMLNTNKPQA